jgi:hypothetical protein
MLRKVLQKSALLLALAAMGLFHSCSTDIDLLENYKPITIVYGLLDAGQDTQYIKVNKAFLGEGNALVMAQQGDSVNYKPGEISVQLQQLNPSTGEVLQTITCDTTTQIAKDQGLFSNPYQLLFKTTAPIDESSNYRVLINRAVDGAQISAVTPVVDSVEITYPTPVTLIRFYNASTQNYVTFSLKWKHSADAEIYSAKLRFTYYDSLLVAPFTKDTITLEMNLPDVLKGTTVVGGIKEIQIDGADFYSFIDASVSPNPNAIRWADNVLEISLSAGAQDLNTYIEVNKPTIGLIQEKPVFTNITNGTGIFSSRWSRVLRQSMDGPSTTKANQFLN